MPARSDRLAQVRLVTKVARLYHVRGLRQRDIAERLHLSQPRVSRLLRLAEDTGIVRTTVVAPEGIYDDLEDELELRFGLADAHVVDTAPDDDDALHHELGVAAAALLQPTLVDVGVIGFTSWSRPMTAMVDALEPTQRPAATHVVQMLGDLGDPSTQHGAAHATQRLADLTGAEPVFLRTPGVAPSAELRAALLAQAPFVRQALEMLDAIDLALVGIGPGDVQQLLDAVGAAFDPVPLQRGGVPDAAANIDLRLLDADGRPVASPLDDLVVGVTLDQVRSARRTVAVAGGRRKHDAILAVLRGGWLDVLVTDLETAERVVGVDR